MLYCVRMRRFAWVMIFLRERPGPAVKLETSQTVGSSQDNIKRQGACESVGPTSCPALSCPGCVASQAATSQRIRPNPSTHFQPILTVNSADTGRSGNFQWTVKDPLGGGRHDSAVPDGKRHPKKGKGSGRETGPTP